MYGRTSRPRRPGDNDSAVRVLGEPTLKRIAQELVSTVCLILIWSNAHEIQTMPYDPSKHLRRSIRLKGYDYTQAGAYFVTICTQHGRTCLARWWRGKCG